MEWNYVSKTKKSSGYEEFNDFFKKYNSEYYKKQNQDKQNNLIEETFLIYREKNIFPIWYYNDEGIENEILNCMNKEVVYKNPLNFKLDQGQSLCRFLFPNMMTVQIKDAKNNSMYERFMDDHKLKRAIKFCFDFDINVSPQKILGGLRLIGGGVATNFKTMNAKAIYENFCPANGIIYDFSCGFGGRMLGALSSKKNYKYFGVEPNTETYNNLNIFGNYIEKSKKQNNIYKIYKKGSEEYFAKENYVDFIFSSPPYFNLEKYSEEESQCYNKFNNINDWIINYVQPTISLSYKMLKSGCFYAVNIADFNYKSSKIEFVSEWISFAKKIGFKPYEKNIMKLQTRRGAGHKENGKDKEKNEGIFIFKK